MASQDLDKMSNNICNNLSDKIQMYMQSLEFFDDNIDSYIYIYDLTTDRVYSTDKIRKRFPFPPAQNNSNKLSEWYELVYQKDRELVKHYQNLLFEGKINSFDISFRLYDKKKSKVWVNLKGTLRENVSDGSVLMVGHISEMLVGHTVDSLTGLCNSQKCLTDLRDSLRFNDGYLMLLDIDNFKSINLKKGRYHGDNILKKLANCLDSHSEFPVSVYRLHGDGFAVNFPNKNENDVVKFYNSIQKFICATATISAGVVSYSKKGKTDEQTVYQYAEDALYQAKLEGKDRIIFFSEDNYQKNLEQVELLDEIKSSIKNNFNGFYIVYQPQIDSKTYKIHGVEALLRYTSPTRGQVSPAELIPLLEQSALIEPVGEWILKNATNQCKKWREYIPELHMSINISYVQLKNDNIKDTVINLINDADLPGEAITIELTESFQLQDFCHYNKIFYAWKEHGIKISIDDFGTGYSSLSYLKCIETDEVKIDKCFVDHIQCNAYNYRLLSNMVELAHSAKVSVCCEGIESIEELIAVQELQMDIFQGFLFSKPCTVDEFEQCYIYSDSNAYKRREMQEANFQNIDYKEGKKSLDELRKEEISSIVESMDEIIYVSDVDTYELYYLNTAGRRTIGIYDYKGCKCYKVLQGRDEPCEFCNNNKLSDKKFLVWDNYNSFLKKHYLMKDKLIPWQGKNARLELAIDVTQNNSNTNDNKA